jgi:molybdate transport system substrate-binding protein
MVLRFSLPVCLPILLLVLFPARRAGAVPEVTVFAPASLQEALTDVGRDLETRGEFRVRAVFGATSMLARQIRAGARGDVFLSADESTMNDLERSGDIVPDSRRVILTNQLAVVVPQASTVELHEASDLASPAVRRLALAEPATVPAGRYARAWLEREGLWQTVASRVVAADSVRAALARVAAGHADAGIVYRSDLAVSSAVRLAWIVPRERGPAIRYPAAVLRTAREESLANTFIAALRRADVQRRFAERGFGPPPEASP